MLGSLGLIAAASAISPSRPIEFVLTADPEFHQAINQSSGKFRHRDNRSAIEPQRLFQQGYAFRTFPRACWMECQGARAENEIERIGLVGRSRLLRTLSTSVRATFKVSLIRRTICS